MKKTIYIVAAFMMMVGSFSGCKEKDDDVVKINNIDPMLIGEWSIIKFAYTVDENNISNEVIISNCTASTVNVYNTVDYDFSMYFKICNYAYSISGERIKYIQEKSSCWQVIVPWTNCEMEIANALQNAYKFVIKGNELVIYFTGSDNKNLLILKKR
jgi:hypothetical protein